MLAKRVIMYNLNMFNKMFSNVLYFVCANTHVLTFIPFSKSLEEFVNQYKKSYKQFNNSN